MSTRETQAYLGERRPLPMRQAARPRTVTITAALLAVPAILGLASLAVSVPFRHVLGAEQLTANSVATQLTGGPTNLSLLGVGSSVLLSVIFLALAAFVLRGGPRARVATRVFCGLGLLCFGVASVTSAPSPAKSVPGWYVTYSASVCLVALASYAAIIVLLALRPSQEHFAKRPA
jgi:hypothetical protein